MQPKLLENLPMRLGVMLATTFHGVRWMQTVMASRPGRVFLFVLQKAVFCAWRNLSHTSSKEYVR